MHVLLSGVWELVTDNKVVYRYAKARYAVRTEAKGVVTWLKKPKQLNLHHSLASLGDGLLSSVGSQRDEAKRQASSPAQDLNPGPVPRGPMVNSRTKLKPDVNRLDSSKSRPKNSICSLPTLAAWFCMLGACT